MVDSLRINQIDWTAIAVIVSAASTLALTVITAVYVYLTYRLVRAQEQPLVAIRLAAQETAARSLADILARERRLLDVSNRFPLDLTKDPSDSDFENIQLEMLQYDLLSATSQLSQPLAYFCHRATSAVNAATLSLLALQIVIHTEERKATAENRGWSWDKARETYLTEVRQRVNTKPEWEEIVAGKAVLDAKRSLEDLNDRLVRYLLADPSDKKK